MSGLSLSAENESFSRFSISDGLSQNTVLSIAQDNEGNMWFATMDGLNRFDSYGFTVYNHDPEDGRSVGSNIVRTLLCDSGGRLLAGTDGGVSIYDAAKDRFLNLPMPQVTGIAEIGTDRYMAATEGGLRIFVYEEGMIREEELPSYMSEMQSRTLCRQENKVYVATSDSGLFVYSIDNGEFYRISFWSLQYKINVILPEERNVLWLGTEGDGLFRLDMESGGLRNWRHSSGVSSISSNYVRSLGFDEYGRLWIGTFNGLDIMDGEEFDSYRNNPFMEETLSQNSVRSIFADNQNGMWLGTYFGGVNYWHPLKNRFKNMQRTLNTDSLNDNIISCIVEDDEGVLWIGTNNGGVNRYESGKGNFKHYLLNADSRPEGMESNDVKTILLDPSSPNVYIGVHAGGLNILNKNSGQIENLHPGEGGDVPENIYSLIFADERHLWVGSLEGLWLFDIPSRTYSRAVINTSRDGALMPQRIKVLHKDSAGHLWVGGEDGLGVYVADSELRLMEPDSGISAALKDIGGRISVQCIFTDSAGALWIGTRSGIFRYLSSGKCLGYYSSMHGLPNNIIHGIEEDSHGRLWISTNCGLSCFNPYSETFRNYTVSDGLQSNLFNTGAHCRTEDGTMYFGGINGITFFVPETFQDSRYSPQPRITELRIHGKTVQPDDVTGILSESISMTGSIELRHRHNNFSLEFSAPDFLSNGYNTFSYRLEGFDDDWNLAGKSRTATYSNLPKGRYRFLLKSANSDGVWNDTPTVLEIRVRPVWYQSILSRVFFCLLAIAVIYAVIRLIVWRKNLENRLKLEKQENEHNAELSQMKMRFFVNVSHEFRNPLTLIINPLADMINKTSDIWMRKQLKSVERNARRMLHLVNQLMDYRRADLGVFRLRVKEEDVDKIVRENWSYYENLAKSKKLRYTLSSEIRGKNMYVDEQYLELILNNLLSNAFKYTEKGDIAVELYDDGSHLVLKVRDTGIGIAETEKDKIFERFYQLESSHIGSGIGLSLVQRLVELHHGEIHIESVLGQGSEFTVKIPQDLSLYSSEELEKDGRIDAHTTNTMDLYAMDSGMPAEERYGEESGHVKRAKILIAEDNEEIRTYMYNGLSRYFEILLTSNGVQALEKLKDVGDVDMVITDLMMPVMDGMKLCAAIKQDSATNHIPVIMLSAKNDEDDIIAAFRMGADDYILKPFSMAVLTGKVQNMMRTYVRLHDKATGTLDIMPEKVTFNAVDEDFLSRAIAVIERNMDNADFTADMFAKGMNMSRSNLHIKLKGITGESALEFIHRVRFKEACRLLEDGRYTVSEVSDRTGFSTPSYFATCFKKYMGCIPSEYVRKTIK